MRKLISILLILSLILTVTGCNKASNEAIGIRGVIKEIHIDEENGFTQNLLIEGDLEEDTMYDNASVVINDDTEIYIGEEKATFEDLKEGITVEIIFDGPVEESYPVQGTAKIVKVLKD